VLCINAKKDYMPSSAVLINNAGAAAAAPFRRRAARSAATHNRGSSLTVRATGKAVWANEDEEGRKEISETAGFEQDFFFNLGGAEPAPLKGIRFDTAGRCKLNSVPYHESEWLNINPGFKMCLSNSTLRRYNMGSTPVTVTIERPLGIVFEDKLDGIYTKIVVDEIVEGSNASKADVQVGDVLRITTAVFNIPGVIDVTAWLNPPKSTNCKVGLYELNPVDPQLESARFQPLNL
jgi:hypothetical protein